MSFVAIYAFVAFWTGLAAARTTRWNDPLEIAMFVGATLLWPIFWLLVGYWLIKGDIRL
jgi:hypothetical protein